MVTKNDRIYIRITTQIKEEFEKVAEYHGLKSAALLHSLIVKAINETKKENPDLFIDSGAKIMTLEEAKADDKKKQKKDREERKK
jgi:antitoxin component of RelBE/YafQ-DinJ toxin-antitoxin module